MKTLRDKRQEEFANMWLNGDRFGILYLCPRFGKIYTTINILEKLDDDISILIAYPDVSIKKSWQEDFKKRKFNDCNVTYTTHLSLKKHSDKKYGLIIIDEVHLLSTAQIIECQELFKENKQVVCLTGTLSKWTAKLLKNSLGLNVIAKYSISQAIDEGVISDYQITVVKVALDNKLLNKYGINMRTEANQFKRYTYVIEKLGEEGSNTKFLRLARMRILQNSLAKLNKTKQLIQKFKNERVLVFCGTTKIADSLGIPSHHSKSKNKQEFIDFAEGRGNHMAVVKIGNTGITYKPLNRVIVNYFDSNGENLAQKINRCMAFEYDNPDKKAQIYIISSDTTVEGKWLQKALEFFDKTKIRYE